MNDKPTDEKAPEIQDVGDDWKASPDSPFQLVDSEGNIVTAEQILERLDGLHSGQLIAAKMGAFSVLEGLIDYVEEAKKEMEGIYSSVLDEVVQKSLKDGGEDSNAN